MPGLRRSIAAIGVASLAVAGCGDGDSTETGQDAGGGATLVATTTILGDVVETCFGDQLDVVTIMPVGADPHSFQASAQQANEMREADALIVNGGDFEEGLLDVIEAAGDDGTPTFEAISPVATIDIGDGGHEHSDEEHSDEEHSDEEHSDEEHSDEEHSDEEHSDEEGHDHEGVDPHFWTDPARMSVSVAGMTDFLIENVDGLDAAAVEASAEECIAELDGADADAEAALAAVPEGQRIMVTDHDSFGYFADRYDFEIAGTVIPSGSTADGASAGEIAELAELIEAEGVPAIFVGTTVSDDLAQTLAAEVGSEVQVVELYTGSLGEPDSDAGTYIGMIRTNTQRIADALS